MSTRRIDDPGSFGGDAIGALVAQLPGATRLSHVLTAGAKHLEAQQLQQRKSADVAGYARSKYPAMRNGIVQPYAYTLNPFATGNSSLPVLINNYKREYAKLKLAGKRAAGYTENVLEALAQIKRNCWDVKDLDYLRQNDAYVALAFIFKQSPSSNLGKNAKALLREALYNDRDNAATEQTNVVDLIKITKDFLGGSDVAAVNTSRPDWTPLSDDELVQLDKLIRGDPTPPTPAEVERMKRAREEEEEEEEKEEKANEEWVEAHLNRQKKKKVAQGDSGVYSYSRNPDDEADEEEDQLSFNPR